MSPKKIKLAPACANCSLEVKDRRCFSEKGKASAGCPTLTSKEILAEANQEYQKPDIREFARQASLQEAECYCNRHQQPYIMQPTKTRIVEICEFIQKMGYRKVGLAFCLGLAAEAACTTEVFEIYKFEVISVVCKAGRTPKRFLDLSPEETIFSTADEPICNPINQAKLLEAAGAEFHVLLGLCVGHDSLFLQTATVPVTILSVKDRVTGHNPLAALYTSGSYFKKIKYPGL
jgi:uncharacterized metal-binding protein